MILVDEEVELLQHTVELLMRLTARHVTDADIEDGEVTADQIRYLLAKREERRTRGMPYVPGSPTAEESAQIEEDRKRHY